MSLKELLGSLKREMIVLKTPEEIERMRESNRIVYEILEGVRKMAGPGISTYELDRFCEEETRKRDAIPAFKGYKGYPYSLCTSINDEVVHGMPSKERRLRSGDILSLDFGVLYDGYYGDAAITIPIGDIDDLAKRLLNVTEESLYAGIERAVPGNRLFDISSAIQRCVEGAGFSVVRDFVGHGIGRQLHEPPQVPNFGTEGLGIRLREGMVLAIEPMVNAGGYDVRILDDGWTAVTSDGSLSAHFEHTVAITDNGPDILSRV